VPNPDVIALFTFAVLLSGCAAAAVGVWDYVYRLGLRRTRRSGFYDRVDALLVTAGLLLTAAAAASIYADIVK